MTRIRIWYNGVQQANLDLLHVSEEQLRQDEIGQRILRDQLQDAFDGFLGEERETPSIDPRLAVVQFPWE